MISNTFQCGTHNPWIQTHVITEHRRAGVCVRSSSARTSYRFQPCDCWLEGTLSAVKADPNSGSTVTCTCMCVCLMTHVCNTQHGSKTLLWDVCLRPIPSGTQHTGWGHTRNHRLGKQHHQQQISTWVCKWQGRIKCVGVKCCLQTDAVPQHIPQSNTHRSMPKLLLSKAHQVFTTPAHAELSMCVVHTSRRVWNQSTQGSVTSISSMKTKHTLALWVAVSQKIMAVFSFPESIHSRLRYMYL